MASQVQTAKVVELVRDGWKSDESLYVKNAPIGGPVKLTRNGQTVHVHPDGSITPEKDNKPTK